MNKLVLGTLAVLGLMPTIAMAGHSSWGVSVGFGVSSRPYGGDYANVSIGYSSGYGHQWRPACPPPMVYRPAPVYYPPPVVYAPPPVVYEPAPVAYAPAPVVYESAPVYYAPPPVVYYAPAPVYCPPPVVYTTVRYHYGR